jgi:hypothetical protein
MRKQSVAVNEGETRRRCAISDTRRKWSKHEGRRIDARRAVGENATKRA